MSDTVFLPASAADRYRSLLRSGATLDAALARPHQLHAYQGEEDPVALAGCLLWAVTRAHALIDGNKRASIVLADEMLAANGRHLEGHDDDLVALALDAAAGSISEQTLVERMRVLARPGQPPARFEDRYPDVIARLAA